MEEVREAIIRTLCFQVAWNYAPTLPELVMILDEGVPRTSYRVPGQESGVVLSEPRPASRAGAAKDLFEKYILDEVSNLKQEGLISESSGRFGLTGELPRILAEIRERDPLQARKRRRAVKVARWLAALGGVRFVALANTTALGNARDQGDLDFFIIAKAGTIWTTRLLGAGPFKLAGLLPTKEKTRDAVCLSYFAADDALDLSSHMLEPDDPYFRYWFLSLLPLYDDGVSQDLWEKNAAIRKRHPFARGWIVPPDLSFNARRFVPRTAYRVLEPSARTFQKRWFPKAIKEMMNRDSRVMVDDHVLKFHVDDRRAEFRDNYRELCRKYQVTE